MWRWWVWTLVVSKSGCIVLPSMSRSYVNPTIYKQITISVKLFYLRERGVILWEKLENKMQQNHLQTLYGSFWLPKILTGYHLCKQQKLCVIPIPAVSTLAWSLDIIVLQISAPALSPSPFLPPPPPPHSPSPPPPPPPPHPLQPPLPLLPQTATVHTKTTSTLIMFISSQMAV